MKLSLSPLKYKSRTVNKGVKRILVTTQDLATVVMVVELAAVVEVVEVVELAAEVEMVELAVVAVVAEVAEFTVADVVDEVALVVELAKMVAALEDLNVYNPRQLLLDLTQLAITATCQFQFLEEDMGLGMKKKQ